MTLTVTSSVSSIQEPSTARTSYAATIFHAAERQIQQCILVLTTLPRGRTRRTSAPNHPDFVAQKMGVREVLQTVEDALIEAGFDDFMVVTEWGSFHWTTVERERQANKEEK